MPNDGVRIRAGQTALAVKKKTGEYQVAVSDGLYNLMCPDATFPGCEEPNVYLLNESDDPQTAIAIFAETEATKEGGRAHGILASIKPWLIVNDWSRGIVRVPFSCRRMSVKQKRRSSSRSTRE